MCLSPINAFLGRNVVFSKKIEVKAVLFGKDTLSKKEQRQKVKNAKTVTSKWRLNVSR